MSLLQEKIFKLKDNSKEGVKDLSKKEFQTYSKIFNSSEFYSGELASNQQDVISVILPNSIEYLEVLIACIMTGNIFNPIPFFTSDEELERIFKYIKPKKIITTRDLNFSSPPKLKLLNPSEVKRKSNKKKFEKDPIDGGKIASLYYSSGTTGNPKGVLYSHKSTLLHAWAGSSANGLGLSKNDSILMVVPMFHVMGWGLPYIGAMNGIKLVLPGMGMDGASLVELIENENVSLAFGVPTIWLGLLNYCKENKIKLESVRQTIIGGSAVPYSMIKQFDEEHDINVVQGWGMTETSPLATANIKTREMEQMPKEDLYRLQTKQGKPVYGVQLKIVDDDGNRLPEDGKAFGKLLIKGPWINKRYYKYEEDAVDADGWFDTGDISNIDSDGYMTIVDRAKDVIKSGGEWISSVDLENAAQGHPEVIEACVIGVAHPKWDERPLLLVIAANESLTKESIYEYLEDKIAKWWNPDDIVFVTELPHGATGKLLKTELREKYADHLMN